MSIGANIPDFWEGQGQNANVRHAWKGSATINSREIWTADPQHVGDMLPNYGENKTVYTVITIAEEIV